MQKLKVEFGRTVNLGNFENVKIAASLTQEVSEEMDKKETYNALKGLFEECEGFVLDRTVEQIK